MIVNINESAERLWTVLGQIPLNRADRITIENDLKLLYSEAKKAQETKKVDEAEEVDKEMQEPCQNQPAATPSET